MLKLVNQIKYTTIHGINTSVAESASTRTYAFKGLGQGHSQMGKFKGFRDMNINERR